MVVRGVVRSGFSAEVAEDQRGSQTEVTMGLFEPGILVMRSARHAVRRDAELKRFYTRKLARPNYPSWSQYVAEEMFGGQHR